MSQKTTILYVDDEPINLLLFKGMFEKKYTVFTVDSGIEAIEFLNKNADIQVVISDMKMPLMNGLEFIAIVKPKYPNICFFMLSGYELTNEIKDSISKGMILKYFQKPFKTVEIVEAIEENIHK